MITREDNIRTFRRTVEAFRTAAEGFLPGAEGAAERFAAAVREALTGGETDAEVAAVIEATSTRIWDEVHADEDDAMEAWQDDIDSGWAVERIALDRAWSSC